MANKNNDKPRKYMTVCFVKIADNYTLLLLLLIPLKLYFIFVLEGQAEEN